MSHHLSNSLSASAASALHVLGGRLRTFAPSPRVVLGTAALASAGVLGIAGVGVASSHTTVMLEVNGVSRPVTAWGNTVGDALAVAGVKVGSSDLVQPGVGDVVREGDTIVVRTSKAYTVTVDVKREPCGPQPRQPTASWRTRRRSAPRSPWQPIVPRRAMI